jgi:hypothetical protein
MSLPNYRRGRFFLGDKDKKKRNTHSVKMAKCLSCANDLNYNLFIR